MTDAPARGQVLWADVGHGEKPWLVVSNNARNNALDDFLAVRITTTAPKVNRTSQVALSPQDPLVGWVLCDDLQTLFRDEIRRRAGALTHSTMMAVETGLRAALAIN